MKKYLSYFCTVSLCLLLLSGCVNKSTAEINDNTVYAELTSKPLETALLQVQPNKMICRDWQVTVTDIRFWSGDAQPTTKAAEIQFAFEGSGGKERPFFPDGKVVAVTGNSGKVYTLDHFDSIDRVFNDTQSSRLHPAKGTTYYPGEFKLAYFLMIDKDEVTFTSVTYQFENGKEAEIPIHFRPDSANSQTFGNLEYSQVAITTIEDQTNKLIQAENSLLYEGRLKTACNMVINAFS